jgi:hypothetical protein
MPRASCRTSAHIVPKTLTMTIRRVVMASRRGESWVHAVVAEG